MEASELNQILEQHKLWVDGKGGKRALLGGADLRRADLYYADLRGASLTGANLMGANLRGADLTGSNLSYANLRDASLTGANLMGANLWGANLRGASLTGAYLSGANLALADLSGAIGLPYVYWIIPGCLVQLNRIKYDFYLEKENKYENFVQDSIGFIVQNNSEEETFDMLAGDRIIRNIPDWVKYSGLKKIESESV